MLPPDVFFPLLAILLLGIAKGGFGGVGAPVALPIMSLGLPVEVSIGVLLPVLLTIDVVNFIAHRKNADYPTIFLALPGAVLGVVIGAALIKLVPGGVVGAMVGVIAIVFALQALRGPQKGKRVLPRGLAPVFGAFSGLTSSLAHAGGPPIHIYFLSRGYEQLRFVATSNIFMASVNLLKIIPFFIVGALNGETLGLALKLVPVAAAAALIGYGIARVLPKSAFRYIVNGLMILAGMKLVLDAVI